jgi:hypothetical protein
LNHNLIDKTLCNLHLYISLASKQLLFCLSIPDEIQLHQFIARLFSNRPFKACIYQLIKSCYTLSSFHIQCHNLQSSQILELIPKDSRKLLQEKIRPLKFGCKQDIVIQIIRKRINSMQNTFQYKDRCLNCCYECIFGTPHPKIKI